MVAAAYRTTRLTATTSRAAIAARNAGVWLAGFGLGASASAGRAEDGLDNLAGDPLG